jgi:hypothetical protein
VAGKKVRGIFRSFVFVLNSAGGGEESTREKTFLLKKMPENEKNAPKTAKKTPKKIPKTAAAMMATASAPAMATTSALKSRLSLLQDLAKTTYIIPRSFNFTCDIFPGILLLFLSETK